MKKASGFAVTVILIFLFLTGCSTTNEDSGQDNVAGSSEDNSNQFVVDGEDIQLDEIAAEIDLILTVTAGDIGSVDYKVVVEYVLV